MSHPLDLGADSIPFKPRSVNRSGVFCNENVGCCDDKNGYWKGNHRFIVDLRQSRFLGQLNPRKKD